jgi:hypothetical protein
LLLSASRLQLLYQFLQLIDGRFQLLRLRLERGDFLLVIDVSRVCEQRNDEKGHTQ